MNEYAAAFLVLGTIIVTSGVSFVIALSGIIASTRTPRGGRH